MTNHSGTKIKLVMTAVAALFAAVTTVSYADDDQVKAGGPTYKPGRQIDDDIKTGGPTYKPGRQIDDERTVKSGKDFKKPGRMIAEDKRSVKTRNDPYKPGRALNEDKRKKTKPVEE